MDWILLFLFSCPASIVFPYWACKNPLALLGSRGSAFVLPSPPNSKNPENRNYLISILRGRGLFKANIDKVR